MMRMELIVARGKNGVIGLKGKMPWHLPEDLKHFKETTMGCPVLMGRKTWESLGRPLPGRKNVVITRQADYVAEGACVVPTIEAALEAVKDEPVAFIMGGAQIYQQTLPLVKVAHVTVINADYDADAYFKPFDDEHWLLDEEQTFPATDAHPFSFSIRRYLQK